MGVSDWVAWTCVKLTTMSKWKVCLIAFVLFLAVVIGIGAWRSPPSSSAFVSGWTRQQYRDRFGEPQVKDVGADKDLAAAPEDERRLEIWQYQASDCYVFVIFRGSSSTSKDVVRSTVGFAP